MLGIDHSPGLQALLRREISRVLRRLLSGGQCLIAVPECRPRLSEVGVGSGIAGGFGYRFEKLVASARGVIVLQGVQREAKASGHVHARRLGVGDEAKGFGIRRVGTEPAAQRRARAPHERDQTWDGRLVRDGRHQGARARVLQRDVDPQHSVLGRAGDQITAADHIVGIESLAQSRE